MIKVGRVLLVPAGDQAPVGREVPPHGDRHVLAGGSSVAVDGVRLIETDACGTYLRVERPTRLLAEDGTESAVDSGLYQVIRTTE